MHSRRGSSPRTRVRCPDRPAGQPKHSSVSRTMGRQPRRGELPDRGSDCDHRCNRRSQRPLCHPSRCGVPRREVDASRLIRSASEDFLARGEGMGLMLAHVRPRCCTTARPLTTSRSRQPSRRSRGGDQREMWFTPLLMVELIEAATRGGQPRARGECARVLSETNRRAATPWARGIEARSRALLAKAKRPRPFTARRSSISAYAPARRPRAHAPALRRVAQTRRRRIDARTELRTAHELLLRVRNGSVRRNGHASSSRQPANTPVSGTADTLGELTRRKRRFPTSPRRGQQPGDRRSTHSSARARFEYHLHKVFASSTSRRGRSWRTACEVRRNPGATDREVDAADDPVEATRCMSHLDRVRRRALLDDPRPALAETGCGRVAVLKELQVGHLRRRPLRGSRTASSRLAERVRR